MSLPKLCMGCMQPKQEQAAVCPNCGYRNQPRNPAVLPYQAVLHNKFLIGRILGNPGGFGVTYLAWDLVLQTTVAIKEYFPSNLATRSPDHQTIVLNQNEQEKYRHGLEQFLAEARTLAQFSHPNVVRIREFFTQNNTAYLVMDYYEGVSLEEFVHRKGGKISEHLAYSIMLPILDGLKEVHQKKVLHRDIKPANIYLTKGDVPILLDFGAARFAIGQTSQSLSVILTGGFAPFEQYLSEPGDQLGPWSDIYACGATLYLITTGVMPENAINRHRKDTLVSPIQLTPTLTPQFSRAIMAAMLLDHEQRPQTIQAFQALLLSNEPIYKSMFTPPPSSVPAFSELATEVEKPISLKEQNAKSTEPAKSLTLAICPHCRRNNSVPTGETLNQLHCRYCGKKLDATASNLPVAAWILLLLLPLIGFGIYHKYQRQHLEEALQLTTPPPAATGTEIVEEPAPSTSEVPALSTSVTEESEESAEAEEPLADDEAPTAEPEPIPPLLEPKQPTSPATQVVPGQPQTPPLFAITACANKNVNDACSVPERRIEGTCYKVLGRLACIPKGLPPPP